MHGSVGKNGAEMGLEWALKGLERGLHIGWIIFCRGYGSVFDCCD